jgi:hypothetical protein
MASSAKPNGIATAEDWQAATETSRRARAERLTLPSGATILAVRPEPLEWVMSGRLPQRLLAVALEPKGAQGGEKGQPAHEMTGEEILELAQFAHLLIEASVLEPPIGDGPDEIPMGEIPPDDCAFIFEWACRALSEDDGRRGQARSREPGKRAAEEEVSSGKLERFRPR